MFISLYFVWSSFSFPQSAVLESQHWRSPLRAALLQPVELRGGLVPQGPCPGGHSLCGWLCQRVLHAGGRLCAPQGLQGNHFKRHIEKLSCHANLLMSKKKSENKRQLLMSEWKKRENKRQLLVPEWKKKEVKDNYWCLNEKKRESKRQLLMSEWKKEWK